MLDMGRVMHGQHDAGDELGHQHDGQNAAEGPPVVEVLRRREIEGLALHQFHDRKPLVHPFAEGALRLIVRRTTHKSCP